MVGPPSQSQLSTANEMNFNDFCQRARVNAVVSKQAHYVTLVDGQFKVTTEPQYTDQIRYTAYPERPFPLESN